MRARSRPILDTGAVAGRPYVLGLRQWCWRCVRRAGCAVTDFSKEPCNACAPSLAHAQVLAVCLFVCLMAQNLAEIAISTQSRPTVETVLVCRSYSLPVRRTGALGKPVPPRAISALILHTCTLWCRAWACSTELQPGKTQRMLSDAGLRALY